WAVSGGRHRVRERGGASDGSPPTAHRPLLTAHLVPPHFGSYN
ncbi:MAG: hypothetical protein AVDCRST_MAG11-1263, partial [uncultured Gemmatimonadaceae bacterium]